MWYVPVLKGLDGALIVVLLIFIVILASADPHKNPAPLLWILGFVLAIGALIGALFIGT